MLCVGYYPISVLLDECMLDEEGHRLILHEIKIFMFDEEGHRLIVHLIKICMLDVEGHRLILHQISLCWMKRAVH
jgi:hypothetical protein